MTDQERIKWDERYATGEYRPRPQGGLFLESWLGRLPTGRALDIACGAGRHAIRLAESGLEVDAVDISQVAVDLAREEAALRGLEIRCTVADLDTYEIPPAVYDVITVIRFVNRDLWPRLVAALKPGGMLLVEHHLRTEAAVGGPRTEAFRLAPQELLTTFSDLRVVFYEETLEPADDPSERYALARMVAYKDGPAWDRAAR